MLHSVGQLCSAPAATLHPALPRHPLSTVPPPPPPSLLCADVMALRCKGWDPEQLNFPRADYARILSLVEKLSRVGSFALFSLSVPFFLCLCWWVVGECLEVPL